MPKPTLLFMLLLPIMVYGQYEDIRNVSDLRQTPMCHDTVYRMFESDSYTFWLYKDGGLTSKGSVFKGDTSYTHTFFYTGNRIDSIHIWQYTSKSKSIVSRFFPEYDTENNIIRVKETLYNIDTVFLTVYKGDSVLHYKNGILYFTSLKKHTSPNISQDYIEYPDGTTSLSRIHIYDPVEKKKRTIWFEDGLPQSYADLYYDENGLLIEEFEFEVKNIKNESRKIITSHKKYNYIKNPCSGQFDLKEILYLWKNKVNPTFKYIYK